jgi:hypothetical protein
VEAPRRDIELKATTFRSYVELLRKDGQLDAVKALVPPETAALIDNPPLASSWMGFVHPSRRSPASAPCASSIAA